MHGSSKDRSRDGVCRFCINVSLVIKVCDFFSYSLNKSWQHKSSMYFFWLPLDFWKLAIINIVGNYYHCDFFCNYY